MLVVEVVVEVLFPHSKKFLQSKSSSYVQHARDSNVAMIIEDNVCCAGDNAVRVLDIRPLGMLCSVCEDAMTRELSPDRPLHILTGDGAPTQSVRGCRTIASENCAKR